MPRISYFYGVSIYMYYYDHAPPHFHAIYGESEAVFGIAGGEKMEGSLPKRATALVHEWATIHHEELLRNGASPTREPRLHQSIHFPEQPTRAS